MYGIYIVSLHSLKSELVTNSGDCSLPFSLALVAAVAFDCWQHLIIGIEGLPTSSPLPLFKRHVSSLYLSCLFSDTYITFNSYIFL